MLRCISALEEIGEGRIDLDGRRISGRGVDVDARRARVGMVFQSFNLFPHMTVLENATLAPRTHEMGFAKEVATSICYLHEGVIHERGTPAEIFGDPTQDRTRQFLQRIIDAGRM